MSLTKVYTKSPVSLDRLLQEIRSDINIVIAVDEAATNTFGTQLTIGFKADMADWSFVDSIVTNHSGEPLPINVIPEININNFPTGSNGGLKTEVKKPADPAAIVATHDFTDPCTWYSNSLYIEDESLTDLGAGTVWQAQNDFIIDLNHARMPNENDFVTAYANPVVTVNDVLMVEKQDTYAQGIYQGVTYTSRRRGKLGELTLTFDGIRSIRQILREWNRDEPTRYTPISHNAIDATVIPSAGSVNLIAGDYELLADNGTILFNESKAGQNVKMSYRYATDATLYLIPAEGKAIEIIKAEVNFSKDCKMKSPINFEVWAYNPADLPNKVCVQKETYKSMKDFISTGNLGQGEIPAVDTLEVPTIVFPFDYTNLKEMSSAYGVELRITVDDNIPVEGTFATGTFYISIKNIT